MTQSGFMQVTKDVRALGFISHARKNPAKSRASNNVSHRTHPFVLVSVSCSRVQEGIRLCPRLASWAVGEDLQADLSSCSLPILGADFCHNKSLWLQLCLHDLGTSVNKCKRWLGHLAPWPPQWSVSSLAFYLRMKGNEWACVSFCCQVVE